LGSLACVDPRLRGVSLGPSCVALTGVNSVSWCIYTFMFGFVNQIRIVERPSLEGSPLLLTLHTKLTRLHKPPHMFCILLRRFAGVKAKPASNVGFRGQAYRKGATPERGVAARCSISWYVYLHSFTRRQMSWLPATNEWALPL